MFWHTISLADASWLHHRSHDTKVTLRKTTHLFSNPRNASSRTHKQTLRISPGLPHHHKFPKRFSPPFNTFSYSSLAAFFLRFPNPIHSPPNFFFTQSLIRRSRRGIVRSASFFDRPWEDNWWTSWLVGWRSPLGWLGSFFWLGHHRSIFWSPLTTHRTGQQGNEEKYQEIKRRKKSSKQQHTFFWWNQSNIVHLSTATLQHRGRGG